MAKNSISALPGQLCFGLTALEALRLSANSMGRIDDVAIGVLATLPKLGSVSLFANPLDQGSREKLKRSLKERVAF